MHRIRIEMLVLVILLILLGCAPARLDDEGPVPFSTVVASTAASTVRLTVANHSTEVICAIYVAPADGGEWGENLLVGEAIVPGDTGSFELVPGSYDLRADNCFDVPLAEEPAVDIFESLGWRITTGDL